MNNLKWHLIGYCIFYFFYFLSCTTFPKSSCAPFICYFMLLVEGRSLVKLLLHAGADPAAQDAQHGRTALHAAAMANDVELVKVS